MAFDPPKAMVQTKHTETKQKVKKKIDYSRELVESREEMGQRDTLYHAKCGLFGRGKRTLDRGGNGRVLSWWQAGRKRNRIDANPRQEPKNRADYEPIRLLSSSFQLNKGKTRAKPPYL